jgi:hypothetical protein
MREPKMINNTGLLWVDFNRRVGTSRGDVGIRRETYIVKPGDYESVHISMPPMASVKSENLLPQPETAKLRAPA